MSAARDTGNIAVVGLGAMGANLARNFASRDLRVAVYDRAPDASRELAARHPDAGFVVAETFGALVQKLERPRRIVLLVPAGKPVDDVLDALDPLLERGDVVVDAGNSRWTDTDRHLERAAGRPWRFVGMGVSGGAEGALRGPSMMPGGERDAWELLRPALEVIAAKSDFGACVTYCGQGSAGHFVKTVHNGIEYGVMQQIAESAVLLRTGLGLTGLEAADAFAAWNEGPLEGFLVGLAADCLRTPDPEGPSGALLVDVIEDRAGQKGTGTWTVEAALELGVAVPTIAAAVAARVQSSQKALRVRAAERYGIEPVPLEGVETTDLERALQAAAIASYAQGFELLAAADRARDYGIDRAEVARIWTGGCILRARLLGDVVEAFRADPALEQLALAPAFAETLAARLASWRRVVAAASESALPIPALSASLAWFDTLVTARGSASLIQAQRDAFGHHGFERVDRPGETAHGDWLSKRG